MRFTTFITLAVIGLLLAATAEARARPRAGQVGLLPVDELIESSQPELRTNILESTREDAENNLEEIAEEGREVVEDGREAAERASEAAERASEEVERAVEEATRQAAADVSELVGDVLVVVDTFPDRFDEVIEKTDQLPGGFSGLTSSINSLGSELRGLDSDIANDVEAEAIAVATTASSALAAELDDARAAAEGLGSDLQPVLDAFADLGDIDVDSLLNDPLLQAGVGLVTDATQDAIDFYFASGGDYALIGDILSGCPPTMATDALSDLLAEFDSFLVNEVGIPQAVLDDLALAPPDEYASSSMSFYVQLRFKWYVDLLNDATSEIDYPHPAVTAVREAVAITAVLLDRLVLCIDSAADEADGAAQEAYRSAVLDGLAAGASDLDADERFSSDDERAAMTASADFELTELDDLIDGHDAHVVAETAALQTSWEEALAAQRKQELTLTIQAQLSLTGFETLFDGDEIPTLGGVFLRASPSNHLLALPESEGGLVEQVDEVVVDAIGSFLALGIGVNDAEDLLAQARDERDAGEYRRAFLTYSLAYLDAVNAVE
ncbi:MAG: hypothetical protein AAF533_00290 [Acidobacteriota bacterium]